MAVTNAICRHVPWEDMSIWSIYSEKAEAGACMRIFLRKTRSLRGSVDVEAAWHLPPGTVNQVHNLTLTYRVPFNSPSLSLSLISSTSIIYLNSRSFSLR